MRCFGQVAVCSLCAIILIGGCTPPEITPAPTEQLPTPEEIEIMSFFFTINPTTIVRGQCAVVRWAVEPEGDWPVVFNYEPVGHVGELEICPDESQRYELVADPPGPGVYEEFITLEVIQPGDKEGGYHGPGEILVFSAQPDRISLGECTALEWEALAPPDMYFTLNGEPVPASGTRQVCPAADTVYELVLFEPSESVYRLVNVWVDQGSATEVDPQESTPSPASTPQGAQPAGQVTPTPKPAGPQTGPTSTVSPTATAGAATPVPVQVATLAFPTATQTPMSSIDAPFWLKIVDIFLVSFPVGEVNVRVKNTSNVRIETPPNYEVSLSCQTTIYSPDHAPVSYSGYIRPIIRLNPGEVGIYNGFYQVGVTDQTLDFTNGWGDVTCHLAYHFSSYAHYTERLP